MSSAGRIRAKYDKSGMHISRPGRCCLCPCSWSLTKHHVFGRGHPATMRLCASCHAAFNKEVNDMKQAGPFVRHVIAIMATVWPVSADLPTWEEA